MRHRTRSWTLSGLIYVVLVSGNAGQASPPGSLIADSKLVSFEIVQGRIVARNTRFGQSRGATRNRVAGQLRESISLKLRDGVASVQYERSCPKRRLLANCSARQDFQLQSEPKVSGQPPVTFHQPSQGKCRLMIGDSDEQQTFEATTVWHLLIGEPVICRRHLLPLLESLRPNWHLAEQAERLQAELIQIGVSKMYPSKSEIWSLIDQMSDRRFQVRQDADRRLRGLGQAALGYLRNVQRKDVSAEQFRRIRQICDSLRVRRTDTPQSAAVWLLGDQEAWEAIGRTAHNGDSLKTQPMQAVTKK